VSVHVTGINKESGVIMMSYSVGFQSGKEPLGEEKLNSILNQLGQNKISFTNKNGDQMYLEKQ
jgi:hypothetical protein